MGFAIACQNLFLRLLRRFVDTCQGVGAAGAAYVGQALGDNADQKGFVVALARMRRRVPGYQRLAAPCAAKKRKVSILRCVKSRPVLV